MGGSNTNSEKVPELAHATTPPTMSLPLSIRSQLYSLFDNKILFIASMVIFETRTTLCEAAPSLYIPILGRAICGIRGMGIYMGTMNMVSALSTGVERPHYLGFVGLTWGIGTILGPIIHGAFTDSPATWRWAFYINLCIGAIAAPVYIFLVPSILPIGSPGLTPIIRIKKVDTAGALLSAGTIVTLIMAIYFGGVVYEWKSGQLIGLFVTIMFFDPDSSRKSDIPSRTTEVVGNEHPFAHTASAQIIVTLPIYFIPIYFQFAKNFNAMRSGIRLLPFVLVFVFSVMLNGALMTKLGLYMPWYFVGSALTLIGSALVYTKLPHIQEYSVLAAFGVGLFSQARSSVAQVKVAPEQLSHAVAFISVSQVGDITLVLAIANSIFLNQATKGIAKVAPAMPKVVIYIDEVLIMLIVAASFSLLLSVFMKRERLFRTPT
ncbi:efflux pump antibiotic resistance protein [Dendryphion nanum]|uniref:Efflux pump antibiotic resistance protein n=1 Tax=Dendryphion nanum TaxID=256645 RepID=A0A9P9DXZ6_9PLEO|nr:efflux pump antibiotic resistance protein [Dendryphion nanum]